MKLEATLICLLAVWASTVEAFTLARAPRVVDSVCAGRSWDYRYRVVRNRYRDVVRRNFAQEAFIITVKAIRAQAVTSGVLPRGTRTAGYRAIKGCYHSIRPGRRGVQIKGMYEFYYMVRWRLPTGALVWNSVVVTSVNRRRHPHALVINAWMW